ncbi:MAG: membrane protein insertase YidC [Melioribacteraceae bacterium]|nr:membrane protein insertase YidC [Melioribacteraceae bacterium]MCF8265107.1 membrane protein insertase YidC [Melioribacteraceae bacterium]MCF8413226.1 membrane protein insertase YidC [Melioribacteraceae bacterium]MCF8431231.1 membrane protein insertase YidC [Melioribacteraceae bacterium]
MDRQTTIAFVLIGVILVAWLYINAPDPNQQPPITDQNQVTQESQNDSPKVQSESELPKTNLKELAESVADKDLLIQDETEEKPRIITIDTDLYRIELTTKGARFRKIYLKEYETWYHKKYPEDDFYNTHVQLVNTENGGDLNVLFVTKEGQLVNTAELNFDLNRPKYKYELSGTDSLNFIFSYDVGNGGVIRKIFTFYGNKYDSKFDVELENLDNLISSYRYDVVWSEGLNFVEENSVDEANYSNAIAYSGDETVVIDASSVGEKVTKDINGKVDWVSIRNKYFAVIIAPKNASPEGGAYFEGVKTQDTQIGDREYYSASLKVPFNDSRIQKNTFDLYIGPIQYDILTSHENNYEAIFDFGGFPGLKLIIRPISEYILLPLFIFLHGFIPNYGFVIIVFSIIIKIALYPLTHKSYESMKKMQMLQPKITELKEKYKGDPQKLQKEQMKIYGTYGVSPMGGCMPMLLQMPILFALFTFFNVAIEIRHEPFIWWITNLSSPDIIYELPFTIPLVGVDKISGLAPLLGITMFFQQKMTVKDPTQKALVYVMPFMFTFLFMSFSSGLNLYYFMFNLLSIGQQYYINQSSKGVELVPIKDPKKRKGFMTKMMEAAEAKQKAGGQSLGKRKKK